VKKHATGGFMGTVSALPAKQESIRLTPAGQKITKDLTIVYLPDGTCDFFVHGSDRYVVLFNDPKVFGVSIATLKKGDNLFPRLNGRQTELYIFTESTAVNALHGDEAATGPIIVPPKGPGPHRIQ
jgi:hypothetical protein